MRVVLRPPGVPSVRRGAGNVQAAVLVVPLDEEERGDVGERLFPQDGAGGSVEHGDDAVAHFRLGPVGQGALVARAEHVHVLIEIHRRHLRITVRLRIVRHPIDGARRGIDLDDEAVVIARVS